MGNTGKYKYIKVTKDNYCTSCQRRKCADGENTCSRCQSDKEYQIEQSWNWFKNKFYHEAMPKPEYRRGRK